MAGLVGAAAVVLVAVATFAGICWYRLGTVPVQPTGSGSGTTTYLLVGSDARTFVSSAADARTFGTARAAPGQHADVIVLVRVGPGRRLTVLPVPRDLIVSLPDGTPERITMTLGTGPQLLVNALCSSLGIGVDHVALIHMDGLRSLVDDVGGIDVYVDRPERDLVTGFVAARPGWNRLDGSQALAYVRARHLQVLRNGTWTAASAAADERSGRASTVLTALGRRLHVGPSDPVQSALRIWELSGAVSVDGGANPLVLLRLGDAMARIGAADRVTLPITVHGGPVPTATIDRAGISVLKEFSAGSPAGCSTRIPVEADAAG